MTSANFSEHKLIPFARCDEPEERMNKIAPMGYAVLWFKPDGSICFLNGYGGDKTPLVMLARGIAVGVEAVLLDDADASITVVTEAHASLDKAEVNLFKQLSRDTTTADGHDEFRRLAELEAIGRLSRRAPIQRDEGGYVNRAKELAKEVAQEALADFNTNRERYRFPGVYVSRDRLPNEQSN